MNKNEALRMAIEFMETLTIDVGIKTWNEKHRKGAINACEEALEQPKEWQGLSDDEVHEQIENASIPQYQGMDVTATNLSEFARAIEAKLKEKNDG